VIVDSGKFDWTNGKFPLIADPDQSYHGLNFVEALKPMGNIAYITKARVSLLRDLGPALSPFNSFLFLQGLETIHLRMPVILRTPWPWPAIWKNIRKSVGSTIRDLSPVRNNNGEKYLPKGAGAIIGFGIKGGAEAGKKFIESLEFISHLANVETQKLWRSIRQRQHISSSPRRNS